MSKGAMANGGRSWAELVGPRKVKFHHPCGHTTTVDYAKVRNPIKRLGEEAVRMLVRWWSKERGGVNADCQRCKRAATKAKQVQGKQ